LYLILPSVVTGCAAGCLVGGVLCKGEVELGLVPPAAFMLIVLELLVGTLPFYSDLYIESGLLMLLLAGVGFFSGIILIPVQAYQKYFVRKELRSAFFSWFYLPFGMGIMLSILLSRLIYVHNVEIFTVILLLAVLWAVLASFSFGLMSQFLLRMLMKILLMTLYRLRITGRENLPEEGPALIVANRASFVDIFFISACTSRPVRFMMHESLFRNRMLSYLYRAAGFLEVPENKPGKLRKLIYRTREALAEGELVCVFPEGEITRNGTMSAFGNGFSFLLPRGTTEVPVIPLRIGMTWGSIFSCYYGKFKLRIPHELPHPATVTIGKPIPKETSTYELRIILTELAAETEMTPGPMERPFHSQFAFIAKRFPLERLVWEYTAEKSASIRNFTLLLHGILLSRKLRQITAMQTQYIGVMLPNSIRTVMSLLAVQMADRIPAVLNYTSSVNAMHEAVRKTGLTHIITSRAFVEELNMAPMKEMIYLEDLLPETLSLPKKILWSIPALLLPVNELMKLLSPVSWQDVNRCGVVIFSSGSTGIPKGVMLSHHNINADLNACIKVVAWTGKDVILGNLPMFHAFGLSCGVWLPLMIACKVVYVPSPLDCNAVSKACLDNNVSIMLCTPTFMQSYLRRCDPKIFTQLRLTITGAERLRMDIVNKFGSTVNGERALIEGYGCTE
ncbi:MAG: AMP-binding protein, partial [Lentisphaeria bacterium]|nr:AMP-binding protein [Lentisphaeria bacterium]